MIERAQRHTLFTAALAALVLGLISTAIMLVHVISPPPYSRWTTYEAISCVITFGDFALLVVVIMQLAFSGRLKASGAIRLITLSLSCIGAAQVLLALSVADYSSAERVLDAVLGHPNLGVVGVIVFAFLSRRAWKVFREWPVPASSG